MPAYQMKQDGAPGKGKGPNPYEIRWRQGPTAAESPPWYSTVGLGKRRTEMGYAQMPETVSQRGSAGRLLVNGVYGGCGPQLSHVLQVRHMIFLRGRKDDTGRAQRV
ncbi:hypothetical protein ACCO45_007283 [Purpureocillium lilacinum]|uniref:Uncharacterized protein n=1 Tax=Purpureocillium lilacinum TaxID=33203 RepID=A0ACC4DS82_PURLI